MQPETVYGYAIKGIQGGLNVIYALVQDDVSINESHFAELHKCEQRLSELMTLLEAQPQIAQSGAQRENLPGPESGPLNIDR